MKFSEFINRLHSVISAGGSTAEFTKTIFEAIATEDAQEILDAYKSSSYKSFFNGYTSISSLAKKINVYLEPMEFEEFLSNYQDAQIEILCDTFRDVLPDISLNNASEQLAGLFVSIITEAAATKKKSTLKGAFNSSATTPIIIDPNGVAPDLGEYEDGVLYLQTNTYKEDEDDNPFQQYLRTAASYYSTKKTLLYAEKPYPFYDLYVCNDVKYTKFRATVNRGIIETKTISDATVSTLTSDSKYVIIQGIGGIGKSMLLTHLFLSSAAEAVNTNIIPVFIQLKDYKDTISSIIDFIWKSVIEFDSEFSQSNIINALQEQRLVLLMDGLDEIQTSFRDSFDKDLEAFIKSYPGNAVIITSRPVYTFVSYSKFTVFDILPLTKQQAITLIRKIDFWDNSAKNNFLDALDRTLFDTHYQFASNPLLLTIMLMTYSSFGEVPAKMHVFYSKAYETMARLHDATKGSFKRPLHTNLTPEEFGKYFAQFCARTYVDEVFEFDYRSFSHYMKLVLNSASLQHKDIPERDFLLDLTDNLCIMYREGEKYYFIHRSFQEYFAAVHFASDYDENLKKVGNFFEKMEHRSYTDKTFEMLCDMIPEKIERFVFLPYLEDLFSKCRQNGDEYWEYLNRLYPILYYQKGRTEDICCNESSSFLYNSLLQMKGINESILLDVCRWPDEIKELPSRTWVEAYSDFLGSEAYEKYSDADSIPEQKLDSTTLIPLDELPYQYINYFGAPEPKGFTITIDLHELRSNPHRYTVLRKFMEQEEFPLMCEYKAVKKYYDELSNRTQLETESNDLFDF